MSILEGVITSQIASYDTEIAGISGIVYQLDIEGVTGNALADCLSDDRNECSSNITKLQSLKSTAQAKLTRIQAGWTGTDLTHYNEIEATHSGVYTRDFDQWLADDNTDASDSFFSMYDTATSDFQKTRLLKMTFYH